MANLTTQRWERYTPDLGDNRQLPEAERLELEVASGLTTAQLHEVSAALQTPEGNTPEEKLAHQAEVLSRYVRVRGTHTVNGATVSTLKEYLDVVVGLGDRYHVMEVAGTLRLANSLSGDEELFSQRQSGGWVSTQRRAAAKVAAQTAAH